MSLENLKCNNCKAGFMCSCKKDKPKKSVMKNDNNEKVNHPSHYLKNTGHEVIDVIKAWNLDFNLGNSLKYIARAGKKNPNTLIEDLEKAKWYIEDYLKDIKQK